MTTRAYPEFYTQAARDNLADCFEYGVIGCHIDPDELAHMLVESDLARQLSLGLPCCTVGTTGRGLLCQLFRAMGRDADTVPRFSRYSVSPAYWASWALAFYQWYRDLTLAGIWEQVPMSRIMFMYYPLHEASVHKFVDVMDNMLGIGADGDE